MDTLRIATRKSPLALWQTEHVAERLRARHPALRCQEAFQRRAEERAAAALQQQAPVFEPQRPAEQKKPS